MLHDRSRSPTRSIGAVDTPASPRSTPHDTAQQGPLAAAAWPGWAANIDEIGYITDLEGDLSTFERYLGSGKSAIVRRADGKLDLASENMGFVYGGDLFDRGSGELRLARSLVCLKKRHPDRVVLLMGNRDINKLRFAAELDVDYVASSDPKDVFDAWWDPSAPKLVEFLAAESLADTQQSRLRWMLKHTLGSPKAFEHRRAELRELAQMNGRDEVTAEVPSIDISDEEVVRSFISAATDEQGEVASYLASAQLSATFGDTLFVHGAVEERGLGFVPSLKTRFKRNTADELKALPGARDGVPLHEWVEALNHFAAQGVAEFRASPRWRADGTRGGQALMAYQSRPATAGMSVVVASYVDGKNMPERKAIDEEVKEGLPKCSDPTSPEVVRYLRAGGIRRIVVGHKPSGEAPAVLRAVGEDGLYHEVISADTNYASSICVDGRGGSWTEVRVKLLDGGSQCCLRGALADGRGMFDFALPAIRLRPGAEVAQAVEAGDSLVGTRTADGWWVKVLLQESDQSSAKESRYLISRGSGRSETSRVVGANELARSALS